MADKAALEVDEEFCEKMLLDTEELVVAGQRNNGVEEDDKVEATGEGACRFARPGVDTILGDLAEWVSTRNSASP